MLLPGAVLEEQGIEGAQVKYVYTDEKSGEIVVNDLSPEQVEMIGGLYDLSGITDDGEQS